MLRSIFGSRGAKKTAASGAEPDLRKHLETQADTLQFVQGLQMVVDTAKFFLKSAPAPFCVVGVLLEALSEQIELNGKTIPAWRDALAATSQFKEECTNSADGYESILRRFQETTIVDGEEEQKAMRDKLTKTCTDLQDKLIDMLEKCSAAITKKDAASFFKAKASIAEAHNVTRTILEVKTNLKEMLDKYHILISLRIIKTVDSMEKLNVVEAEAHISSSIACSFLADIWRANGILSRVEVATFVELLKNAFQRGGDAPNFWFEAFEEVILSKFTDVITCDDLNELLKEYHIDREIGVINFVRDVGGIRPAAKQEGGDKLRLPPIKAFQNPWIGAGIVKGSVKVDAFYEECEMAISEVCLPPAQAKSICDDLNNFKKLMMSKASLEKGAPRISLVALKDITADIGDLDTDIVTVIQLLSAQWTANVIPPVAIAVTIPLVAPPTPPSPHPHTPPRVSDRMRLDGASSWEFTGNISDSGKKIHRCTICKKEMVTNIKGMSTAPMQNHMKMVHNIVE